ncbi:MAG: hypothetical protein HY909_17895 [Deltaproteobacteria bacterium]|nr:hypothetical protein [Deltaproteobacteria bacterium]
MKRARLGALAGVSILGTAAVLLWSTRPSGTAGDRGTHFAPRPEDLRPAVDETSHFAPGSPAAVSEAFLRLWWRGHYEDARELSTGAMRARCERNLAQAQTLTPEEREQMRQVQVVAHAAVFDFERVRVTDLEAPDGGLPRREVRGEIHAHGSSPDGRQVESRREQVLELELVDGAWKVSRWQPGRVGDAGIRVSP